MGSSVFRPRLQSTEPVFSSASNAPLACTPAGAPTIRTGGLAGGVADGDGWALRAAERATSAPTLPTDAGDRIAEPAADQAMTVAATTPHAMAMAVTRMGMRIRFVPYRR
jgi:hypothetical protein